MRVLTITSLYPSRSVPTHAVFVRQRTEALARSGADVRVVAPVPYVPPGPVPRRYRSLRDIPREEVLGNLAVAHPRYPMIPKVGTRFQDRAYAASLRDTLHSEIERHPPAILDSHYLYPDGCAVARLARRFSLPFSVTARGSDVKVLGRIPWMARRIRGALSQANLVVAVSEDLADAMVDLRLVDKRPAVVPNGVDSSRFHPSDRAAARGALGLPPDAPIAVCVGRLAPVHRQALLLQALQEPTAPPDLHVCLVGAGSERQRLAEWVRDHGLAERVHFAGAVPHDEIPQWFAAADISALLSSSAGCPNVVLESLACGVPCVVTDLPEMREVVSDESKGQVVPPNAPAVASALAGILARGDSPRRALSPTRSWDTVAGQLLELFDETRVRYEQGL